MISIEGKKEKIQKLTESELRKEVLIPLLVKMGFIDPIEYHHNNEKGKDIICKEFDEKFNKYKYIAVIVKVDDITGSSSANNSIFTVINQIKQAVNEPFKHIYDIREIHIDECIVITSKRIKAPALESIYHTLKAEHIDKAIREFIDISKLLSLIDKNFVEYWKQEENKYELVLFERNNLLNNLLKVLDSVVYNKKELNQLKKHISMKSFDFKVDSFYKTNMYIANTSYSKIELDEIDSYFQDDIVNGWGDIPKGIFEIRKNVEKVLFDIDEIIIILKNILVEKSPVKLLTYCMELDSFVGNYDKFVIDSRDIYCVEELYNAVIDYQERKELMIEKGIFKYLNEIYYDLESKLLPKLQAIYKINQINKDYWLGYKIRVSSQINKSQKKIESEIYSYEDKIITQEGTIDNIRVIEKEYIDKDNFIHIEFAIHNYGFWKENNIENKTNDRIEMYRWKLSDILSNYADDTLRYSLK